MISQFETFKYILESSTSIRLHIDKIGELFNEFTDEEKLEASHRIKSIVQQEAIKAFSKSKGWGCLYMATGVGKSKVAIDICWKLYYSNLFFAPNILLVVPTEKLRDENWQSEFIKWDLEVVYACLQRCCYASLNKYKGQTFDLVILDEGHNITENNSTFFSENTVKSCILLTATKPIESIKQNILKRLELDSIYELSLNEAIKLGITSPYEITVVTVLLNTINKDYIGGSKDKPFNQTESSRYKYLSNRVYEAPNKYNILARMRFIYKSISKHKAAKYILDKIIPQDKRILIFCGSINQAEELSSHSHHSKKRNSDNLGLFKQKKLNRLSCVDSLNEGENIDDLDIALIIQSNSKGHNLVQRVGRFVRYRPEHVGRIIMLCLKDTIDEDWIRSALRSFSGNIRWVEFSRLEAGIETISFI